MARNKSERRHNEQKKYTKRLKQELSIRTEIRDDKGKVITKPTVKDLKKIKDLKKKKNHSVTCSCVMCKGESFDRSSQKNVDKHIIKEEIDEFETRYDEDDIMSEDLFPPIDDEDLDFGFE